MQYERLSCRKSSGQSRRFRENQLHWFLRGSVLSLLVAQVAGWGSSKSSDYSLYGKSFERQWMYDATAIAMNLEGCVWGYVEADDDEDAGCLEESSEDGTYYWYMMSNCRRAQVAYSLYATESGSSVSCGSSTFKETLVTKIGLAEFIYYSQTYDANSPFAEADDGDDGDDDGYGDWDLDDLPMCEESEYGYLGLGCGEDGTFTINYYDDAYCLSYAGTYDTLDKINSLLQYYQSCPAVYSYGDEYSLAHQLVYYSSSCSSVDNALCTDDSTFSSWKSSAGKHSNWSKPSVAMGSSWMTKLKYVMGGFLLLASFVMFTGILFTNRRRRRALMQRKYRQSRSRKKSGTGSKSRSKSRNRGGSRTRDGERSRRSSKSGKSKRSSSKKARKASRDHGSGEGIFT